MPPCLENAQFVVLSESPAGFRFPAFFVGLPAAQAPPGRSEDLSLILRDPSVEGRDPRFGRRFHSRRHGRAKSPISDWVFPLFFFLGGADFCGHGSLEILDRAFMCCVLSSGCNRSALAVRNKRRRASH